MRKALAWVTSLCLASSLFGMPAMSFAEEDGATNQTAAETNDNTSVTEGEQPAGDLQGVNASTLGVDIPVINDGDNTTIEVPDTVGMTGGLVTPAADATAPTDASIYLHLQSFAPAAAVGSLSATLSGPEGAVGPFGFAKKKIEGSEDGQVAGESPAENAAGAQEYYARLSNLPAGSYALRISGPGFVGYEQSIELQPSSCAEVRLIDGMPSSEASGSSRGIMLYGDFDADGDVDRDDGRALIRSFGQQGDAMDLYCSGSIGLEDLQFFATFLLPQGNVDTHAQSRVIQKVDATHMAVSFESTGLDDIVVDGKLDSLLVNDGKSVTLAPMGEDVDISTENPIRLIFETNNAPMEGLTLRTPVDSEGMPRSGVVLVEQTDGTSMEIPFGEDYVPPSPEEAPEAEGGEAQVNASDEQSDDALSQLLGVEEAYAASGHREAEVDVANGLIVVDFGTRIAIKKITIRITATSSNKLAEIAQVEFLNDMEQRIAPPDLNIPKNLAGTPGNKQFRLTWSPEVNITGYEVRVTDGTKTGTFSTVLPTLEVSTLDGKLENEKDYTVAVRSVNGDWRSPWSESIVVTPKATKVPARPTGISAVGGYGEITVKWNSSEDAKGYILYYRQTGETTYQQVTVTSTSYKIAPLPLSTEYTGYVVAFNDVGRSPSSEVWKASTSGNASIKVPQYKLINPNGNEGGHITSIVAETDQDKYAKNPNNDTLNPGFQPEWMIDGNYDTYFLPNARSSFNSGARVQFDRAYEMENFALTTYLGSGYDNNIYYFTILLQDENGTWKRCDGSKVHWERVSVKNANGVAETVKSTWMVYFPHAKVQGIRIAFTNYNYDLRDTISELAFYEYDGIQDSLDALWADGAMYTELKPDVTQATLDELDARVEATDRGEQHPKYALLRRTLNYAQEVFNNQSQMASVIKVDPALNGKADTSPVGGLNDLQPLGVTVRQGDELSVYVGAPGMTLGANASALQLVVAPYHAAANRVTQVVISSLKPGRNNVTINMGNVASTDEAGGQLYVRYDSSTKGIQYTVRTIGGTVEPMLDLHGVTDREERIKLCGDYIASLRDYVGRLSQIHGDGESGHGGAYSASKCTANTTDIVIDALMYSIPATQALAGIDLRGGTAESLESTLAKADDLMDLFYQHKGLKKAALTNEEKAKYGPNNLVPKRRQNIRYMDMSGNVFMYAAGNHIGIQYGSCSGLTASPGVTFDANGKYQSGNYFGWGVCHEIGHEINQGCYTYAEVTNNYYSQLAQAKDTNAGMRWGSTYAPVYKRVTSGQKGAAGGKTGIAMYWQLHLAYDDGLNYKTYGSYDEQMQNLVFARMDSYARNQSAAPKASEGGFTFTLAGANKDNALMRLACAATQRNLLEFFEAWGLTPDGTTQAYAQQWPKEERAIQYISDDVRMNGRLAGMGSIAGNVDVAGQVQYEKGTSTVTVNLSNNVKDGIVEAFTGSNQGRFLGYEILRNGVAVGFVEAGEDGTASFTDTIATINNRVFTYSVRGVDMLLNRTEEVACSPDQVKVSHDGNISKAAWTITGNVYEPSDSQASSDELPCEAPDSTAVNKMIDGSKETVFNGTKSSDATGNAQATINFGGTYAINAIKFVNGHDDLRAYTIETSPDGSNWTTINKGEAVPDGDVTRIYFGNPNDASDKQIHTFDAGYLRLTAPGSTMSIAELDVLGPTGDNVEFLFNQGADQSELAVGRLAEDYVVSEADGEVIPADSTVIIGSFKGNAAYNAIKLYDQDGNILPGAFLFYQDVSPNANIGETADGRWVYFISPETRQEVGWRTPSAIRAELYRVDDALTLEGERLVADTTWAKVPEVLTSIKITTSVSGTPTE